MASPMPDAYQHVDCTMPDGLTWPSLMLVCIVCYIVTLCAKLSGTVYCNRSCLWVCVCVCGSYLTLPYHMGKTFYCLALRPLTGPMRIPKLTVRLQNPQVQYTPGSIPTCGTIPLPSEGPLTLTYPLTCTLSISKRMSA